MESGRVRVLFFVQRCSEAAAWWRKMSWKGECEGPPAMISAFVFTVWLLSYESQVWVTLVIFVALFDDSCKFLLAYFGEEVVPGCSVECEDWFDETSMASILLLEMSCLTLKPFSHFRKNNCCWATCSTTSPSSLSATEREFGMSDVLHPQRHRFLVILIFRSRELSWNQSTVLSTCCMYVDRELSSHRPPRTWQQNI